MCIKNHEFYTKISTNPLKIKKHLRQRTYQKIRSTGARCGIAYGLTKIQKKENPLRLIISTIGTYSYETSKYLSKVLEDYFSPTFKYVIKNSFDFVNKLSRRVLEKDDFMISFDAESLFTNRPIDEIIEIIEKITFMLWN